MVRQESAGPGLAGLGMGVAPLAPFACDPARDGGRQVPEPASRTRTPFQRDRDRIVHSNAFRRLKHKTQVFVATEGDHYRTRLTHTIEVSQIARAFARAFRLDEDLTEAIALVHDFGHTPFGHAGERALDRLTRPLGGFDHNAQALRVVTLLERRYAEFDGLNLSYATLEGLVKHNGPLTGPNATGEPVPPPIAEHEAIHPLGLSTFASLEAQSAALSDDIAYNTHDLDDGLRAGLIDVADLDELSLAGEIAREVRGAYPGLDPSRRAHEIMRRHITRMVEDVIETTLARLAALDPKSTDDVRAAAGACVAFSPGMLRAVEETRAFLFERVYRAERVVGVMDAAEGVVEELFGALMTRDEALPAPVRERGFAGEKERLRWASDYLSGMTDTFALARHRELFDETPAIEIAAPALRGELTSRAS